MVCSRSFGFLAAFLSSLFPIQVKFDIYIHTLVQSIEFQRHNPIHTSKMRSSLLLLATALSVACAQIETPAAVLPKQVETVTLTVYTGGVPGTPGTVSISVLFLTMLSLNRGICPFISNRYYTDLTT